MLRASVFSLLAIALVPTLAIQVSLGSSHHGQAEHYPVIVGDEDIAEWNLDKLPNPDTTDHLVFETVHSLLQHWPNTRMRNGERTECLPGFPSNTYHLQVTTLYREAFRKEHSSTMGRVPRSYHQAPNGLLQILNIRISSAGIGLIISNQDAGISRSLRLDL